MGPFFGRFFPVGLFLLGVEMMVFVQRKSRVSLFQSVKTIILSKGDIILMDKFPTPNDKLLW